VAARHFWERFATSRAVTAAILLLGVILRGAEYFYNRSLWHDEANITLDVWQRSALQLFEPTTLFEQTAPIGWTITERLFGLAFDFSELAMRAWPFLTGLAALPLLWLVARRLLGPLGAQLALLFLALGTPVIRYATEVKPYSSDVAAILVVTLIGMHLLVPRPTRVARIAAGAGGAVLIWFSHVAVFGLAAVGFLGLALRWQRRDAAGFRRDLPVYLLWGVSLVLCYVLYLSRLIRDSELIDYWEVVGGYAPLLPTSPAQILWYFDTFLYVLRRSAGLPAAELAAFFLLLGAAAFWRRDRWRLALLVLPVLLALLASGFGKYAFTGRLTLFAAPCVLLLVGAGFDLLQVRCGRVSGWVVGIGCAVLLAGPAYDAAYGLRNPMKVAEVREALDYIDAHAAPDDLVYLSSGALKPYLYYARRGRFTRDVMINGNRHGHAHFDWDRVDEDLDRLAGHERVWILFSGVWKAKGLDEEEVFLEAARRIGVERDRKSFVRANVYLFDFSSGSTED
jgi:hypothetical protein